MRFIVIFLLLSWQIGSAYYFGKNKIQFNKKHWQIHKTAHFNIYLDKSCSNINEATANIVEDVYDYLADFYEQDIKIIIPIIVFNSSLDFANNNISREIFTEATGGFTEILRNRIVIPFNGNWQEFSHVLTHELNHAFQFNLIYGHSDVLSSSLSKQSLSSKTQPPLWFMEGISEYLTAGLDEKAEMYLKDGIINGSLPTLMEMQNPYRLGSRYYYVYKGAQGFFHWLHLTYGKKKLKHFIHYMLKIGNADIVFKKVLNLSIRQANHLWFLYLKKKYWQQIPNLDTTHYSMHIQSTFHLDDFSTINVNPVFSTDRNFIYLVNNQHIYTKIVKYNLKNKSISKTIASTQQEERYENISILHNALSTDKTGKTLLFTSRAGKHFIFNFYDTQRKRISKRIPILFADLYTAKLSFDGSKIVFTAQKNGKIDLFVLDVQSRQVAQITDDFFTERTPTWSIDGKHIIYASNEKFSPYSQHNNLFTIDLASKKKINLTSGKNIDLYPAYSFDGKKLAFISDRNGSPNLYIHNLENDIIYQVTDSIGGISEPAWSLDNKRLAYVKFHSGGFDVFYSDLQLDNPNYIQKKFANHTFQSEKITQQNLTKNKLIISQSTSNFSTSLSNSLSISNRNHSNAYEGIISELNDDVLKNLNDDQFTTNHKSLSSMLSIAYQPTLLPDNMFFYLGGSSTGAQGGFLGGGTFSFSDLLNEHYLYLNTTFGYSIGFNLFDTDTFIQYLNVHQRINYGFYARIWQYNQYFYVANQRGEIDLHNSINNYATYANFEYQLGAFWQYPLNKFNRLNLAFAPLWLSKTKGKNTQYLDQPLEEINQYALTINLSYTHDSTLLGFLHPIDNERSYVSLEYSPGFNRPNLLDHAKLYVDLRKYIFLNIASSIAIRFINGAVFGRDKKYFDFIGGGGPIHQNYPHINAYNFGSIRGSFLHLLNIEYRLVLLNPYNLPTPLAMLFGQVSGVAFYDIGTAYDDFEQFQPWRIQDNSLIFDDLKASIGLGLRWVLFILPVKLNFSLPHTGNKLGDKWNVFFFIGFDY